MSNPSASTVQEFVLSALNKEITSALATISGAPAEMFEYDAVAEHNVSISNVRDTFQFQSDSTDFTDASAADVKYYVEAGGDYMGLTSAWNPVSSAVVAAAGGTWGAAGTTGPSGAALSNMELDHDYVRNLALRLFGTHFGVDLFTNEEQLISALDTSGVEYLKGPMDAAASKTNADTTEANLCRVLMRQMIDMDVERFRDLQNVGTKQPLPFVVGDSISFRICIKADATQASSTTGANVTRAAGEVLSDYAGLNKLDKVYKVKLNVVA
jgi:hypothetical protein